MHLTSQNIIVRAILLILLQMISSSVSFAINTVPPDDPELRKLLVGAISSSDSFSSKYEAEVWLLDMSTRLKRRIKDPKRRIFLLKNVHYEATRADLSPELILAIIDTESNFEKYAISSVGARGLMQIMPFWLNEIGRPDDDLFDIKTNIRMGCTILKHYLNKEDGNLSRALGRYNGSLGKMKYPNKVYKALDKRWYKL